MLHPYDGKDFEDCVELFIAAFSAPPLNYRFTTRGKTRRYLSDITHMPGFIGFVYKIGGKPAAFCFGVTDDYFHDPQYDIKEFAVRPDLHGKGTGSAFLSAIESHLSKNGVIAVSLQTSRLIPACGFYKKNGFVENDETVTLSKSLG
ncbi:MAG: GNAT family N-acetyltransferase [Defluviitaleaceae bacterium]|nr:GNAT family N-acetyltransferase [Defluviitaleaceae bacterium]